MAAARVILVPDSHLSASAPQAQANWDAVVAYVAACRPDLRVVAEPQMRARVAQIPAPADLARGVRLGQLFRLGQL